MKEYIVTSWDYDLTYYGSNSEILDSFVRAEDATSYVAEALSLDPDILYRAFEAGVRIFDRGEGTLYHIVERLY